MADIVCEIGKAANNGMIAAAVATAATSMYYNWNNLENQERIIHGLAAGVVALGATWALGTLSKQISPSCAIK
jgi:hypothetical protein